MNLALITHMGESAAAFHDDNSSQFSQSQLSQPEQGMQKTVGALQTL